MSSTTQAAVRKGQLFSTLNDLAQTEAFWMDELGRVVGMVEAAPVSLVVQRLGVFEIAWMPVIDAAAREWSSSAEHAALANQVSRVFSGESQRVPVPRLPSSTQASTSDGAGVTRGSLPRSSLYLFAHL